MIIKQRTRQQIEENAQKKDEYFSGIIYNFNDIEEDKEKRLFLPKELIKEKKVGF